MFIKSTVYVSFIIPSTEPHFFLWGGGAYLKGGGGVCLFQILSLRMGPNSKRVLFWSWVLIWAFMVFKYFGIA